MPERGTEMEDIKADVNSLAGVVRELLIMAEELRLTTEKQAARIAVLEKALGIED